MIEDTNIILELTNDILEDEKLELLLESNKDESAVKSYMILFYQHLSKIICQQNRVGSSWIFSINKARSNIKRLTKNKNIYNYAIKEINDSSIKGIQKAISEIESSNKIDNIALKNLKRFKFDDDIVSLNFILNYNEIYMYIITSINDANKNKIEEILGKYLKEDFEL